MPRYNTAREPWYCPECLETVPHGHRCPGCGFDEVRRYRARMVAQAAIPWKAYGKPKRRKLTRPRRRRCNRDALRQLWLQGADPAEIAKALGYRSRESVVSTACQMGLYARHHGSQREAA